MPATHSRQDSKPPLLSVIEAFIERLGRVGDALQARRGLGHGVRTLPQASQRITIVARRCLIGTAIFRAFLVALGTAQVTFASPRVCAVDALFGKIAHRGFHRRPHFFLIRRELETGLHGGDTRIDECSTILRTYGRTMIETMLRIYCGRADDGGNSYGGDD
jgi:hypothetical protein